MGFGDRFRSWQAQQSPDIYEQEFGIGWDAGEVSTTIWPDDWYLGKNLGLKRWEALQMVPGIGGAAAAILSGRAKNGATPPPPPPPDYTPLYAIAGAVVLLALLKR